jgi:hypothetical protein
MVDPLEYKPSHKRVVSCIAQEDAVAMDLTDEQWAVLEPLIGELPRRADAAGGPGATAGKC